MLHQFQRDSWLHQEFWWIALYCYSSFGLYTLAWHHNCIHWYCWVTSDSDSDFRFSLSSEKMYTSAWYHVTMLQLFVVQHIFLMQKAYKVLEQHPQVHGSRIGMLGLSLGTSITFNMAVYSKVMKVRQILLKVTIINQCLICFSRSVWLLVFMSIFQVLFQVCLSPKAQPGRRTTN